MEKVSNLSQALNAAEEIRTQNLDLQSIQELLRHQALAAQIVIYSELEQKDLALASLKDLELDKNYFDQILPFLSPSTMPSLITPSVENYLSLRVSSESVLKDAAISFIAPYLSQLSAGDKADLMMSVVGEETEIFFSNQSLQAPPLMMELIKELELDIKVFDTKTEMAIEYADEPIQVVLHSTTNSLEWRLLPQAVVAEETYWESIKNTLISFSKNTVLNPSFRKYAVAGIALGVAFAAPDALAGVDLPSDIDFDKAKELFSGLDEQLNNSFMPKFGFKGCTTSVDFVVDTTDHLKAHINLGDKQMVFDMDLAAKHEVITTKGIKVVKNMEQFQVYIDTMPKPKGGGCSMTKSEMFQLAGNIKKQLMAYAGK